MRDQLTREAGLLVERYTGHNGGTLIPIAEYLSTTYHPDCEYVDGVVLEKNVGEHDHSRLQTLMAGLLLSKEREYAIAAFTGQRIRLSDYKLRIPDILRDEAAIQTSASAQRIGEYQRFGVRNIWIVDSRKRNVLEAGAGGPREIESKVLLLDVPGHAEPLSVDFNDLFRELDGE